MRKPYAIALPPKPQPPKFSWWASSYPDRRTWYAATHAAADRLRGSGKLVVPSDFNTSKFNDYWKKPAADERAYADVDRHQPRP